MVNTGIHTDDQSLIAVVREEAIADVLQNYCTENNISNASIKLHNPDSGEIEQIVNGGASIVVVQAGACNDENLSRLERLATSVTHGGAFIAILDDPTTNAVRQLFRSGVSDVLSTPVVPNELIAALNTARKSAKPFQKPIMQNGKIVSLLKSAGGVGATTICVNLSRALKDDHGMRVAIVDLDLQFGTVGLALDINSRMNINDVIRAGERLDGTLLKSVMTKHTSGIDVLPVSKGITPLNVLSSDFIPFFMKELRSLYDIILIDLPTAWSGWNTAIFDESDEIAPVLETSVRSADGATRIVQGLNDLDLGTKSLFPIVNCARKASTTRDRIKRLGDIVGQKPIMVIREDEKAASEAADLGRCIVDVNSSVAIVEDFASGATALCHRLQIEIESNVVATTKDKRSFASRIVGLGGRL